MRIVVSPWKPSSSSPGCQPPLQIGIEPVLEARENLVHLGGHGAVEIDGNAGNAARADQAAEVIDQFLGPLDGKDGNNHFAAGTDRLVDRRGKLIFDTAAVDVIAVAVGRFDHQPIGLGELVRAADERLARHAQVAAEDQTPRNVVLLNEQFDHRRAEDMTRLVKHGRDVFAQPHGLVVRDRFQQGERPLDVAQRVKRLDRIPAFAAFPAVALLLELGVFRLDLGRVAEQDVDEFARGGRGQDLAVEPVGHELGQQTAVVDVGVGQQNDVDLAGADRQGRSSCAPGSRVPGTFRNRRGSACRRFRRSTASR